MKKIDKIKKLLALSKSSNVNEAAAALEKAMQIAVDEGIDIADAEAIPLNDEIIREASQNARTRVPVWESRLANELSEFFGCKMLLVTVWSFGTRKKVIEFVGYTSDLELCVYVFHYLKREISRIARQHMATKRFRVSRRKNEYYASYLNGIVLAVVCKARDFYNKLNNKQTPGLILKRFAKVEQYINSLKTKTTELAKNNKRKDAMHAGWRDGQKVNMRHGVSGGDQSKVQPQLTSN